MEFTSRTLLLTTTALLLALGGSFVLFPHQVFSGRGIALEPPALMLARVAGSALLGLGTLAWLLRAASRDARRFAHQGFAVFFLLESVVILMALLAGALGLWGWVFLASSIPLFATHAGSGLGETRPPGSRT